MEGHRGSGGNGYVSDEVMGREEKGGVCGGVDTSREGERSLAILRNKLKEWKDGDK